MKQSESLSESAERLENFLKTGPDVVCDTVATILSLQEKRKMFCGEDSKVPYGRGVPSWSDGFGSLNSRSHSSQSFFGANFDRAATLSKANSEAAQLLMHLPQELQDHLRTCRCTCNHLGYGNYQTLPRSNGRNGKFQIGHHPLPDRNVQKDPNYIFKSEYRPVDEGRSTISGCSMETNNFQETPLRSSILLNKDVDSVRQNYKKVSIGCATTFDDCEGHFVDPREANVTKNESYTPGPNSSLGVFSNFGLQCNQDTQSSAVNHRNRAVARYQVSEYSFDPDHPESPYLEDINMEPKKKAFKIYTWRHWCVLAALLILSGSVVLAVALPLTVRQRVSSTAARTAALDRILENIPLIDGHNDLAWNIRNFVHNKLEDANLDLDLKDVEPWNSSPWSHTDLFRLQAGRIGAQFWAVYMPCGAQFQNAVQVTLEQIDIIKRLINKYQNILMYADSHDSILKAYRSGRIASLVGIEGGHLMGASLSILRMYYDLGVRYMTLTHTCNTPWADSSLVDGPEQQAENFGLNDFGAKVVLEMNRLGMMVDLSHVSQQTMRDALAVSRAPIIFSHAGAFAVCPHARNVPDDVLKQVHLNEGIVMVNFYNYFLTCNDSASVKDVVRHINHIRNVAGIDHVGIGGDFDGINKTPEGLEDVSKYPNLLLELLKDSSWSEEDISKLAGANILRVMKKCEKIREDLRPTEPLEDHIHPDNLAGKRGCWWT